MFLTFVTFESRISWGQTFSRTSETSKFLAINSNKNCKHLHLGYNKYTVTFEFDPEKSQRNESKHGISFTSAQSLWRDEDRVVFTANSETELRFALLASFGGKIWAAFYTMREDKIRIISVRRARTKEREVYES